MDQEIQPGLFGPGLQFSITRPCTAEISPFRRAKSRLRASRWAEDTSSSEHKARVDGREAIQSVRDVSWGHVPNREAWGSVCVFCWNHTNDQQRSRELKENVEFPWSWLDPLGSGPVIPTPPLLPFCKCPQSQEADMEDSTATDWNIENSIHSGRVATIKRRLGRTFLPKFC